MRLVAIDFLLTLGFVLALFYGLRQLERWLHQHIFKVGWLVFKNFQHTTLIYYTFFLPGIILNQLVFWLVAGVLDVRAERAIRLPEKQEVAELKLNFIKLSKKVSPIKVSIISLSPFLAGILFILIAMNNIFHVPIAFANFDGTLNDFVESIRQITATPDFWLWAYILFTVANTMMPDFKQIYGIRVILTVIVLIFIGLFIIGVGDEIAHAAINGPILNLLNTLSGAFAFVIILDLIVVILLAIIENIIELITGDSATFKNGKLVAMRREEVIALRNQERAKKLQALKEPKQASPLTGVPSIYKLPFPIPGPPGVEPITPVPAAILSPPPPPPPLSKPIREEPKVITVASDKKSTQSDKRSGKKKATKSSNLPPRDIVFGGTAADKSHDDEENEVRYEDVEESP